MKLEKTDVIPHLDPRLQRLVERKRRGIVPRSSSSTARGEVSVLARVQSAAAWAAMSEVLPGALLGSAKPSGQIVTGRIPVGQIEAVRRAPGVESLKPAHLVRPTLNETIREIGARADLLPAAAKGHQGKGAIVGIVDFGCDFAHANFRRPDGGTRILALWDQAAGAQANSPFGYGRLHDRAAIDKALGKPDPYAALRYRPEPESHGTHVMDIAAGSGGGTGVPGVAPEADLVFVQLAASDIAWDGPAAVNATFGDSVQLVEAVKFIFDTAGDRPCVVNLSLGTNGGPHDGSTLVEQALDNLASERPNRAIVIAASNSHEDGIHASFTVQQNVPVTLEWEVTPSDQSGNELEIWYPKNDELALELITPSGSSLGRLALGSNGRVKGDDGQTMLFVAHRRADPNNGDHVIDIFLEAGLPGGRWQLKLHPVTIQNGTVHAWIERDDSGPSSFVVPLDNTHTLGSVSCGFKTIVVASYDAHKPGTPISFFSGEGPTRDGRQKPELAAPGHQVLAADATSGDGAVRMSGTSMAAPAVTGVVALALSEAHARGLELTCDQLRSLLIDTARKQPGALAWDSRFGAGRVDAQAILAKLTS